MSNGSGKLVAKDEQETIRSDNLKNTRFEFDYEIAQISPLDHVGFKIDHPSPKKSIGASKEEEEEEEEEEECGMTSFREEHELVEEDGENNDGFRTPTSSDHKIPAMTRCPPAPMKPKPTRKRKFSSSSSSTFSDDRCKERIDLDSSEQVESLFRPILRDEIKKARRDGNNNG
ncbi:cyclin-dependent protein kinase inhibitor SMR3-like [Rhodamnia argentea]|uniref:Cyclin-dependent protein kinase inhibitor SMR3-like n=1 Tax=Rhodamnia argentea TaxID=178133 RepID=A0A8B8P2J5_9MYRT|nr:cyclin-dependent protein kinase inhibitor SMR3-like [Rhodamnia argentea]XP_048127704.1 cyclin-dependent protein kinase inhibitor SMR3-like [Rhodamnia argentea]